MKPNLHADLLDRFNHRLNEFNPSSWSEISQLLKQLESIQLPSRDPGNYLAQFGRGTAFITFDFGIDEVSVEITKYALSLEEIYRPFAEPALHMIAGNFQAEASSILKDRWSRFQIEGINGWNKWEEGRWFRALFEQKIKPNNPESKALAQEIFTQAVSIARRLGKFLIEHRISLLVPVNIASNPGNMALTIGVVLVTELLGTAVLNSNHDFYWESGKPAEEREAGEPPGVRDHFFRNIHHRRFFRLFQALYPWDGRRWLQLNINSRQSRRLVTRYGFNKNKVAEISTSIADVFFEPYGIETVKFARRRMALILSDGAEPLRSMGIDQHLARVGDWMADQQPVLVGARTGLEIDPDSDHLTILLQPTRIVARKRIPRNFDLIRALIRRSRYGKEFRDNPDRQLVLHITGPTPQEHQKDLEKILHAYQRIVRKLPVNIAQRIFVAFSVGRDEHPVFSEGQIPPLTMDAIYRMADVVVFPSETEGRGLPIIEASAVGIPIICSQYYPIKVFRGVIGKGLPQNLQIKYIFYPDTVFTQRFLERVSCLLLSPEEELPSITHNQTAVRARFGRQALEKKFEQLLEKLAFS
jgi:glycosyltransferase involved in cell wall biosynthesis